ncbi:MAG: hypothetical protein SF066_01055 [Thermoanaerobaculia bacterium]|nr:hypothetical protein [Thermoanaerobaculia bacterium]
MSLSFVAVLLVAAQVAEPVAVNPPSWVKIRDPVGSGLPPVGKAHPTDPQLVSCLEAGLIPEHQAALADYQFLLVAELSIDETGQVWRFRVLRKPPVGLEFERQLAQALAEWRFRPGQVDDRNAATKVVVTLPKKRGSMATRACPKLLEKRPPPGCRRSD